MWGEWSRRGRQNRGSRGGTGNEALGLSPGNRGNLPMGFLRGAMFRKSLSLLCGKWMEMAECSRPGERGDGLA